MKIQSIALVAVACATAAHAQVPDQVRRDSITLTRQATIAATLANNPQLDVAREQTAQARAQRVQAIAIPDPVLTYGTNNQPGFLQFGNSPTSAAAGIEIPFPDKFRLRNTAANSGIRVAELNTTSTRQQLAAQASRAYDTLLVAYRHSEILKESRTRAADFLAKTEARFQGGTAARLDVIKARVAVAQADNDIIGAERDISVAADAIDRLIGRPLGTPVSVRDSLTLPPPIPDVDLLERAALIARPELASVAAQQIGARATTSLAKEFWLPDFTLSAQRDYGPDATGVLYAIGIAMPVPIFYWQHSKGEIAESKYRERELAATHRDQAAAVSQDVRATYATASVALRQAIFIRDQLLPAAREAFRVSSASYSLGGSSALDVLQARQDLLDAEIQYADALAAASSARADLERAAGTPLDRIASPRAP
jgi:cobalt-zinc-cadmium efflux system outer membrane protein